MIVAHAVEVSVGARVLLGPRPSGSARATGSAWSAATARARPRSPGCSPARASRPPARSPAGSVGYLPRTRAPATWTCWRATGSCPPAAWTRSCARCARPRAGWPARTPRRRPGDAPVRAASRSGSPPRGGYAAEAEAAPIASSLGLPERVLAQPLGRSPAASAGGSSSPGSCSAARETLLLDEPTNHLDADSIVWLREFLRSAQGRAGRDQPRRRPARGVRQQGVPPRRQPRRARRLQRRLEGVPRRSARPTSGAAGASGPTPRSRPTRCSAQADKMRAKATKAKAAQGMVRRAERLLAGLAEASRSRPGRPAAVPDAGAVRQDPADRRGAVEVVRLAGGLHRRRPGRRPGLAGSSCSG